MIDNIPTRFIIFLGLISFPVSGLMVKNDRYPRWSPPMPSPSILEFTANVDYNKIYQRSLNIHHARVTNMEPKDKLWFAIENGTIFALPLFGDYPGPFLIKFHQLNNASTTSDLTSKIELKLNFNFKPSSSLFSPSNHLLLALFNVSSTLYNHSSLNRYHIARTLSLALNLSESLLTIHKINGSMIKVYFSCDLYFSTDLVNDLETIIDHYYSRRLELEPLFPFPLIEISVVRIQKSSTPVSSSSSAPISLRTKTTTSTSSSTMTLMTINTTSMTKTILPSFEVKKSEITIRPRLLDDQSVRFNRTVPSSSNLFSLKQFYQPLVLVPLSVIAVGLFLCAIIACCLCCNRQSSSSTMLLPTGNTTSPTMKHFYRHYPYRKHRQQYDLSKRRMYHDQRQFISKGIPVVFAEELDEKLEQTHTPLVMRIEKAPPNIEAKRNSLEKSSL